MTGVKGQFTVYYGTFVDAPAFEEPLRFREHCAVGVNAGDGQIRFVEEQCDNPLGYTLQRYPDLVKEHVEVVTAPACGFFFPGFIDTHIHASQYPNCGVLGDDSTLLDWLNKYTFPTEAALSDCKWATQVYSAVIRRTLACGTTTACYYTTIDTEAAKLMAQLCSASGQRALVGKVCMDSNSPDYYVETKEESLQGTLDLALFIEEKLVDPKVKPVVTPRFAPACSSQLLKELGDISREHDWHIQTHLDENFQEIEWVAELFPESKSYTGVYADHGLLGSSTVFAHCVHMTQEEIELVREAQAGIAHCPESNTALMSGECPVTDLYKAGVHKIGLGTDVSAGASCSILDAARAAQTVARHRAMHDRAVDKLSLAQCLYLGTMGGAAVLNMADKVGSFEVGKQFDAQLLDLQSAGSTIDIFPWQREVMVSKGKQGDVKTSAPQPLDTSEIVRKWFYTGDDRNVSNVWIAGKKVK